MNNLQIDFQVFSKEAPRISVGAGLESRAVRGESSPACPSRAKAQSMGRVKIWFTTTSYSHGSRSFFSCFSSFSAPAKQWIR